MPSIRKRLLLYLTVLFTLSWLAVTAATYFEARHEVEEIFDAQLAQSAGIIAELTLRHLRREDDATLELSKDIYGHRYERKISFQVWDGDTLLMKSRGVPDTPLGSRSGFSDEAMRDGKWRVFGMHSADDRYMLFAAESYSVRNELISEITLDALFPLVWALPLIAFLVWLAIGRGLAPLGRAAHEVKQRTPQQLDPIRLNSTPAEIRPLIDAINGLLVRLEAAFRKEREFTSDAAHELRTPLASIKTQAQVAIRSTADVERERALEAIVAGVDRGTHLVEQMLTLARLEPETCQNEFGPVDLALLSENMIASIGTEAISKNIEVDLSVEPDGAPVMIQAYAPGIEVLLRNLLDNAIRYSPEGSRVHVRVRKTPAGCMLQVADNGGGITAEERTRLFDRFYRKAARDTYGCGLGLAISRNIAQLHRAELELSESSPPPGLTVTVRFP